MDLNLGYTQKLISACQAAGYLRNQTAYLLATAYWETGRTMRPVAEAYWLPNAEAWRKEHLRYWPDYGRGFVQLTWPPNYRWAEELCGQPISINRDLALDPDNATRIIVEGMRIGQFTKHRLSMYVDLNHSDFVGARRVINGTDKAQEIAVIAQHYDEDLKAIWTDQAAPTAPAPSAPAPSMPAPPAPVPATTFAPAAIPPTVRTNINTDPLPSPMKPAPIVVPAPVKPTLPQTKNGWALLGMIIAAITSVLARLHFGA